MTDVAFMARRTHRARVARARNVRTDSGKSAFDDGDRKGALAACRRSAGMAINAALHVLEDRIDRYGRSYFEHVQALAKESEEHPEVRAAAELLVSTPLPGAPLISLRTNQGDVRILEATTTVLAWAYALLLEAEPEASPPSS